MGQKVEEDVQERKKKNLRKTRDPLPVTLETAQGS